MGMESFYVNIGLRKDCACDVSNVSIIYSDIGDYKRNIVVSYSFLSFFDGIGLIYAFIRENEKNVLGIESRKKDITNATGSFLEFFTAMYHIWEEKLNAFHSDYGFLSIDSGDVFFKTYKKLKHFIRKGAETDKV